MAEEYMQSKLREYLKKKDIKLWESPYTSKDKESGPQAIKELATQCASALGFPESEVEAALESIRRQAVKRLSGNSMYKETCVATLELILPKTLKKEPGKRTFFETKLDVTAQEVMNKISEKYEIKYISLVFRGNILNPDKKLNEHNIKHNSKVMILQKSEPEKQQEVVQEEQKVRSQDESLKRTQKGFEILSARDGSEDPETTPYLEIADQKGNPLKIPPDEKKALILAMGFHEKGRALCKKNEHQMALYHLLEADSNFNKCRSALLNTVDNYAVLQLDIVWCYRMLEMLTCLDEAKRRLEKAEEYFLKCYGEQKERLLQIKGNTGREEVLFLRLYLLQCLVAWLSGNEQHATKQLAKVEKLYKELHMDPNKISRVTELGFTTQEARLGLRACDGDVSAAATYLTDRKEEKQKMKAEERQKRRRRLEAINTLQELGYSRKEAARALHQAEGDVDRAYNILEEANNNAGEEDSEAKVQKLIYLGFEREQVEAALRQAQGDIQQASELLLADRGAVAPGQLSPSTPSSPSEEPSTSSESTGPGSSGEEPMDVDLVNEVLDDISSHEEDYLDLTLEDELELINQMKQHLKPYLQEDSMSPS
ncbi:NEDD8 ultimate buster 1 [Paramormyrops kingsleyae]|uniref:Negative regulator of ubiquitin like proteins 1 n=1 Tax=Paramormyrops kingsleyae TaxID=1676925 RepID=A0A3B3RCF2_9TELE|nr:NEDD8 ultimate buster 1 [Paramormyrops kingsleyae]